MKNRLLSFTGLIVLLLVSCADVAADSLLDALKENQEIASFNTECVYENELGARIGARFRHAPSGFVLDVLRIQSLPEAFVWVNSPPPSDQGEPHTCEHLLLGKGTKGQYVSALEEMRLGESSAFTMQMQTCYHYKTAAGAEVFFELFGAKLDALLYPNFTDEEIRREVRNFGLAQTTDGTGWRLDEKGTVYNEMIRGFESPWGELSITVGRMVWGEGHPMCLDAGGYPPAIRTMLPDDLRRFHAANYHLNNMGAVVAIPSDIPLDNCLSKLSAIFTTVEPNAAPLENADPALIENYMPAPKSAPAGTIKLVDFPNQNPHEPGVIQFAWPPEIACDNREYYLFDLFVSNLASGQTSNLFKTFVSSQTRKIDLGNCAVYGWQDVEPGHPVYVALDNVRSDYLTEGMLDSLRNMVLSEIATVTSYADGSPELRAFNQRAQNRAVERRRDLRTFLNTPPRFGYRGASAQWMQHLKELAKTGGFRRSLIVECELKFADSVLKLPENIWKNYVSRWKLLTTKPFTVASRPNPQLLAQSEADRQNRVDEYVSSLKERYHDTSTASVIDKYRAEYDANSAVIDSVARTIPMPTFLDNPPLTLDDPLEYSVDTLPGGGPLVRSTFDNMTSATMGLAFNLNVVPESLLVYVSALPTLLTEIGIVHNGRVMPYDEMAERKRREISSLDAYFSVDYSSERTELVLRSSGSDSTEIMNAVGWLSSALFESDLRADNLSRIHDAIDQELGQLRGTMSNSEESWVQNPAYNYWRQNNPLLLSASSFLTRVHNLHRLKWLLRPSGSPTTGDGFSRFMNKIAADCKGITRNQAQHLFDILTGTKTDTTAAEAEIAALAREAIKLKPETEEVISDAVGDLRQSLSDIPDNSLGADIAYLCKEMNADYRFPAQQALDQIKAVLALVLRADNVRGFVIGCEASQRQIGPALAAVTEKLDKSASVRQLYRSKPVVADNVKGRLPGSKPPLFVGLVNGNTRSGVIVNTAECASLTDSDPEKLLDFLSDRLYGGHGAHSMFSKTIGAGLAYSNGLRSDETNGRILYYAERCPDLAQTMSFVVDELKKAPHDPSLADYAVSQALAPNRAGDTYESRGEAMAADLVDSVTPEKVRRFRSAILQLRKDPRFYDKIQSRMDSVYGRILPGYGPGAQESVEKNDAIYFIVGPDKQFESYENLLHQIEGDFDVQRLYPRDFWITRPVPNDPGI